MFLKGEKLTLNYLYKQKYFIYSLILIIISIIFITILLQVETKQNIDAILEVDSYKNFSIRFSTSNINLINSTKDLQISIESQNYYLYDIEFINQGDNIYRINFQNDELYKTLKTNSLYNVKIFYAPKKLYQILFNI